MFNMVCFLELFVSQEDLRIELRYSFPKTFASLTMLRPSTVCMENS